MQKRAVFETSRREVSLDVSVGVHILLVVERSSLDSRSRGCAKIPILTVTVQFCRYIILEKNRLFVVNMVRNVISR